ncbi:autoinducer binding domain-containing protein [Massilia sp. G4R7]|uniref:Autoinducer binding domain-containing protein n=1 Tax=Massilia phyllostachyos TaxID=2898585 RepID=A0ABS8QB44_9BURK|nr:autoinducer binding domain-containing protein [Massilia phyllostachyos]MCD2518939.1 autoinducer binding domain-containing protein [Massilia phyllostachyos]
MDTWQEDQLQALLGARRDEEVLTHLAAAGRALGFDFCAYGLRIPQPLAAPELIMLNNYSASWQARYAEQGYLAVDPTIAYASRSVLPLLWSEEVFAQARPFWEDARAHGLRHGWSQSCHDGRGNAGLLTLARSHDPLSGQEVRQQGQRVAWLGQAVHETLSGHHARRVAPDAILLTRREAEVLRWTADGATSAQVSDRLHISERTVNFHINNMLLKLEAPNKTALAVKALRLGLI